MKKLTLALSAASLALLGAGAAIAQDRPGGGPMGMPNAMEGDGPLTWADFKARADEGFTRIDANHDGVIDKSDREAMRAQMRERRGSEAGHGTDGPPPPPPGGMRGGIGAMMMLRGADTDHDGKITRAEYDASIKMHFDAMDTNHDGQLSKDERQVAREKMRAEMEARMRDRTGNRGGRMGDMGGDGGGMHHGPGSDGDDMPPPPQ